VSSLVTLRPDGTPSQTGGISGVGGGVTVHGATSDNNDTTGVKATTEGAWARCNLTDYTVAAGTRVKTAQVRAHIARTSADLGHYQQALLYLYDPVYGSTGVSNWKGTATASPVVTVTGALETALAGREFTTALLTRMQLGVYWRLLGSVEWLEVRELYVDLDVRNRPAVTSVTVTGATSTTRPTVTAAYTTDTDPATRYRVKVFSSAQYGAGNFNPATSAATWDSGEVLSDAVLVTVGIDLVNSVTYKAYGAIAQDWTGTPDAQWWSDWSAAAAVSSAFTISLIPPAAPSLSVSGVTGVPGYRAQLDVTAPVNLLTGDNASFETSLGQWVAHANCSISRVSTDAADGTWSMQMSSTAGGDMAARSGASAFVAVKAGAQVTALASFRAAVSARSCAAGVRWLNAAGGEISIVYGSSVTDGTGGYTQAAATLTAPGTAVTAEVVAKVIATGGAAEIHRVDKCDIHAGAATVWTPGGSGSQTLVLERGERVAPGRGGAENWAHPDVASAGSVRRVPSYGFKIAGDGGADRLDWEFLDRDIPGAPAGMVHWQTRSGAAAGLVIGTWPYGGDAETEWQFPIVAGQAHIVSYWVWVGSGTLTLTPKIEWMADDVTTIASTSTGGTFVATTTPTLFSYSATAPASGASSAHAVLTNAGAVATADVYVTKVGWGLGSVPVEDRPPSGGPLAWSGVRFAEQASPAGFNFGFNTGQRAGVGDAECPAARPVLYRARQIVTLSGQVVSSANSAYATVYLAPPARTILRDVHHPERAVVVGMAPGDERAVAEDAQVFHPLGRDGRPVKVRDWLSGHDGSWAMTVFSDAELAALEALLASPTELLTQHSEGGRTYLLVTGYSSTRVVRSALHRVSVSYLETGRP